MIAAASIAGSGMAAATARLGASAQNLANLDTPGYRPVRAHLSSAAGGGVTAAVHRERPPIFVAPDLAPPSPGWPQSAGSFVDPALELVEQMQALQQFRANLRVFETAGEVSKSLLSLRA